MEKIALLIAHTGVSNS